MFSVVKSALSTAPKISVLFSPNFNRAAMKIQEPVQMALPVMMFHTCPVLERARQVTRMRKRKQTLANIKKKEERLRKNPPPIPKKVELMLKSKGLWGPPKPIREKDNHLTFATDDVYLIRDFAFRRWEFDEAILNLREHYHPTLLDRPDDLVFAKIELDMRAQRKEKYLDGFSKMVPILHAYDRKVPDRTVMAFVPTEELRQEALAAGALHAGGEELISEVAKGRIDLADIDYFICHDDLAMHLKPLVGLLRDKLPKTLDGTIGSDIPMMVKTFGRGMFVDVLKVKPALGMANEPDYAYCEATIGRLDMDIVELKDNLNIFLETLNENKPKRRDNSEEFLSRCILHLQPLEGESLEPNLSFSIIHPLILDRRVGEQEKALKEGREAIRKSVAILKSQHSA